MPTRRQLLIAAGATLLLPSITARSASPLAVPPDFQAQLKQYGLMLWPEALHGFKPQRAIQSPHFETDFTIVHEQRPFEIRYAVRQYDQIPNFDIGMVEAMAFTATANMARQTPQGEPLMGAPDFFPEDSVRREFGADAGTNCHFLVKPSFSKFTDGLMVTIYKKSPLEVMAYMIYLFNKENEQMTQKDNDLMQQTFYAMQFT